MEYFERIKVLFTDNDVRQRQFAGLINISEAALSGYLRGTRTMPYGVLVQIADYFNVTTDYLLGVTDQPERPFALSGGERELVSAYRTLSRDQKALVDGNIRMMQEQNGQR